MRSSIALARLRRSPRRRPAVALFAIPAVLIGLLAMHVLTTDGMSQPGAAAVSITQHATEAAPNPADSTAMAMRAVGAPAPAPLPAADCCGQRGPSHTMLGTACVLALLVTPVLLTPHLVLASWQPLRRVIPALVAKVAALVSPLPPSLDVLSISRT